MKTKLTLIARIFLGAIFLVFGLNGFLQFIPMPTPPPEAYAFFGALMKTGYFFPVLKALEVILGVLLLLNILVPLSLTILAPIIFNIVTFHLFLDPKGLPMPIFLTVVELFLAYSYKDYFKSVLVTKAQLETV
jgi:putative oxidoreductase